MLLSVDMALVMTDATWTQLAGRTPNKLDLNGEANIPAWWSSAQLLISGLLLALVALRNLRSDRRSLSLVAFSGLFVLMSLDETAELHERVGTLLDSFLRLPQSVLPHTGYWPFLIGAPAALVVLWVLAQTRSFLAEVRGGSVRYLLGLLVLFGGAVGVELLNNVGSYRLERLMIDLEEGMEMIGGSICLWSGLELVSRHPSTAEAWRGLTSGN